MINKQKEKREVELIIADKELAFHNEEKENREADLIIANKELALQNKEKEKRAAELIITNKELKEAKEKITKVSNLYAFISQVNQNIVRVKDEATLFRNSCNLAIKFGKFKMAWIGMFDNTNEKISLIEQSGIPEEDLSQFANVTLRINGPQDYVLTTGTHFISNDIENDPELENWKPFAAKHHLNSFMVLPIKKSGNIIGTLNLYSTELNFSESEEIKLLIEVAGDISFALDIFDKAKRHQASEERYRYLFENNPMPMWVSDFATFKFLDVNKTAILQYGYTRNEFLSMTAIDLRPDEDKELFINANHSFKINKENNNKGIWKHRKKDGTIIQVEVIAHEILFEGAPARLILANDVNEQKKAEAEILKLNENLENRVRERTEELEAFTYTVSHDLRAPLRRVNMYAKMLEVNFEKYFDAEGSRLIGIIQKNAIKMDVLIVDMLALSNAGNKAVNRSLVDMTQLTEKTFAELNKTFSNKVEIKINPLHPVMADNSLIAQVMENLISNAVKYSAQRENPFIEIKSEKKEGELIYSVSDNGTGFDMRFVHKLFGVFERLHSAGEFEGTGVGLAIVKRIINKYDGRVWAESELGKGATFYFSLPGDETITDKLNYN